MRQYLFHALCGFLACSGASLMYNIHGPGLLICALGAALSSGVYFWSVDFSGTEVGAAFLAAVVVGIYAEAMARLRRCPVTGYLQVALLPLVPGAGIYYAMRYAVFGEMDLFLSTLGHTLGIAAAISVGAMLSSSVFRAIVPHLPRRKS